jgi:peptide-methionine (S)-S-oxide reductase
MGEATTSLATLGGGCFWCLEAVFQELKGVVSVTSGYAGGSTPDPTYRQVCSGATGHAEVVQVAFDPSAISFRELVEVFFVIHDPTTPDRQGADVGTQYRSIILHHSEDQLEVARAVLDELREREAFDAPIVTELVPLDAFYAAEPEHDDYYRRNPGQPYCRIVISPKLEKFRRTFAEKRRS